MEVKVSKYGSKVISMLKVSVSLQSQQSLDYNMDIVCHLSHVLTEMLQGYMEKENTQAAIKIQKTWRGHRERLRQEDRRDFATRSRAAVLIQRTVCKQASVLHV